MHIESLLTDDPSIFADIQFCVSATAVAGAVIPANWQQVARAYGADDDRAAERWVAAFLGNALDYAAKGDDLLALASLHQAVTLLQDRLTAHRAATLTVASDAH